MVRWPRSPWLAAFPPPPPQPVEPGLFGRLHRYYAAIRLPMVVHQGLTAEAFPSRPATHRPTTPRTPKGRGITDRHGRPRDLPVLSMESFVHAQVLRPRGVPQQLALTPPAAWPSAITQTSAPRMSVPLRGSIAQPARPLPTLRRRPHERPTHGSGPTNGSLHHRRRATLISFSMPVVRRFRAFANAGANVGPSASVGLPSRSREQPELRAAGIRRVLGRHPSKGTNQEPGAERSKAFFSPSISRSPSTSPQHRVRSNRRGTGRTCRGRARSRRSFGRTRRNRFRPPDRQDVGGSSPTAPIRAALGRSASQQGAFVGATRPLLQMRQFPPLRRRYVRQESLPKEPPMSEQRTSADSLTGQEAGLTDVLAVSIAGKHEVCPASGGRHN